MTTFPTCHPRHAARVLGAAAAVLAMLPAAASAAPLAGDGEAIVFERSGAILTVPPAGGVPIKVADGYDPAVSPDGSRIAYEGFGTAIWTVRRDGSDKRELIPGARDNTDPAWSADGTQIAFASRASGELDIWTIAATGGVPRNLTRNPANAESNPTWSPDGARIAYQRVGCGPTHVDAWCVFVMNSDGSAQANLTHETRVPGCESQPGYRFNGTSRDPAWSPNGTKIAFTGPANCKTHSGTDIWIMDANGAGKTNLTGIAPGEHDAYPAFSPDGAHIVYAHRGYAIFTMTVNGGSRQRITTGSDYRPFWAAAPNPAPKA